MQALLGMVSSSINATMEPKLNAFIDEAYRLTLTSGRWISTNRVHYETLPVDAVTLPYPTMAAAGSVYSVAVWDEDEKRFICMERATMRPRHDYDPLNAVGGDDDESVRDEPMQWSDEGDTINFYPPADQAYTIRMGYSLIMSLASDTTECPIDGELVKLYAMSLALTDQGDANGAQQKYLAWERRKADLERLQRTGEMAEMGELITDDPRWAELPVPNYDKGPY